MLNQMVGRANKRVGEQLAFRFRPRGGLRKGAGRKARPGREGLLPHVAREAHDEAVPVHVTARAVGAAPNLRSQRVFAALRAIFAKISEKGFRLLEFSVQGNHLHLVVEADDGQALARGIQRLLSRAAMAVNAIARRSGRLWRDRHHRQPLRSPRHVRNALVYVIFNHRRHQVPGQNGWEIAMDGYDPCSSSVSFQGWSPAAPPPPIPPEGRAAPVVVAAQSWLATEGWRRRGLVRFDEFPRPW